MSPAADRVSTRKAFNWTKSSSPLVGPAMPVSRSSSHRGHARTRSLNTFADWNDFPKANNITNAHAPRHLRTLDSSRPMSIDLSILSTTSAAWSDLSSPEARRLLTGAPVNSACELALRLPMNCQTLLIAGIEVDVWTNPPIPTLNQLPISVLFILHGRSNTRRGVEHIVKRMLEVQSSSPSDSHWKRELYVVTLVSPVGTAQDVSNLIDFLPSYLFPEQEREIEQWALAGFSLGGHSTWIALKNGKKCTSIAHYDMKWLIIPIQIRYPAKNWRCPDYLNLMFDRATRKGFDTTATAYFPPNFVAYVKENDPCSAPVSNHDETNPYLGKKILAIAGGKDRLVPWQFSAKFYESLQVGEHGVKEMFIDDEAGHNETRKWFNAISQQTTEIDAKIAANATHVASETQETRLSVPSDFLPVERVQFQEEQDLEVTDFETTPFNKLVRQYKRSGSSTHDSSHQKPSNLQWHSPLKALVHRFELAGTTKNEVYYLVKDSLLTDVSSILLPCQVVQKSTSTASEKDKKSSQSRQWEYVIDAAYDPITGIYYPINWENFLADRTTTVQTDKVSLWNMSIGRTTGGKAVSISSDSDDTSENDHMENDDGDGSGDEEMEELSEEDNELVEEKPASGDSEGNDHPPASRKKRKLETKNRTPAKRRKGITQPTPHSKKALKSRKKYKIRPPTIQVQDNSALFSMEDDPFLRAMYTLHECNPFTFVEINGLRVPEPNAAYPLLWEAIVGHDASTHGHLKISPKEALKRLTLHFGVGSSENSGPACIVLMDELDQLVTTKQDVVYNFFNWPNLTGSKLIVLAVANTHDLPERALSAKVRRMVRINFAPYTKAQLAEIVNSRLKRAQEGASNLRTVMKPDAILYAAARVGGVSGDARRVLDISTVADVVQVISLMQNTPTAGYVAQCSFHEKVMLAAALMELRNRHLGILHQLNVEEDTPQRTPSDEELLSVLDTLVQSGLLSIESGALASRKAAVDRKVIITAEKQEIKRVLVETGQRWHAALGVDV
ncbi:13282_t:CDS:10 [Acaulospora colombiana]|uniref:13282_t:CDS:1 n=1 Tax=Acaulospora colombiana TaxID=27376 RepID=A0ACA9LK61_9GLOM|nr:13282_t:CDS:10 [Acaulospora colombiana]